LRLEPLDLVLNRFQLIGYFLVCIKLHVVAAVFVSDDLLLEFAVVETGHGEFCLAAGPLRDR
jgi:hypothetical protein